MTISIFDTAVQILLDSTVKGTVLLIAAIGLVTLLKSSSAAARHRIWSLSLVALLCLPLLSRALPVWRIQILPGADVSKNSLAPESASTSRSFDPRALADDDDGKLSLADRIAPPQKVSPQNLDANDQAGLHKNPPLPTFGSIQATDQSMRLPEVSPSIPSSYWSRALLWVWSAGVVVGLVCLAAGIWKTNQILVTAAIVHDESWVSLTDELCQSLGLHQKAELRFSGRPIVPMTWGIWKPTVLLPQSAGDWPLKTRRTILLHELIHIQRRDIASQLVGRLACTIYWFHPLAWYCLRQMRIEREQACDDAVVHYGERASDYAEQLLTVAQLCLGPSVLSLAVEVTRRNSLEQRLQALFDAARSHQPLGRCAAWSMLTFSLFFVCGIAILKPVERSHLVLAGDRPAQFADAGQSIAHRAQPDSKRESNPMPGLIGSPQPLSGNRRWQMYKMKNGDSADSVGWSPDGRWLAMAIGPVVRLFDSQKGMPSFKTVIVGHLDTVFEVQFNHRGDRLATASNDGTVRIWDLDGREQFVYREHKNSVLSVSWHPDDTRLASSSSDGTARIWSTDGTTVAVLKNHEAPVTAVAWNPNGKLLATGCENKTIRYWTEDGTPGVVVNDAHIGPVRSIEWNRDGSRLLSCDFGIESASEEEHDQSHMKLWDTDGKLVSSVMIDRPLSHVSWNPEGTIAIAGSWKAVWSWRIGEEKAEQHHVGGMGIVPVAWRPTGDLIAAGPTITNADWEIQGTEMFPLQITALGLNPAGTILAAGREDRTFVLFNSDGRQIQEILPNPNPWGLTSKQGITWNPDGSILLPGFTSSYFLQKFDSAGQRIGDPIPALGGTAGSIAWSTDGRWIAGIGNLRNVWLLDVATSKSTVLGRHKHGATAVRFTPDQKYVCSAGYDGCIRFWTLEGVQAKVFETVAAPVNCVAVSKDGQLVASGHQDRRIRIWNSDGGLLKVISGHGGYVEVVEFNPEGTVLASGGRDHTVRIWKRDGTPVAVFRGHSGPVFGLQWTPDGRGIYSCAEDGTIRRWNVETGATEWLVIRGGKNDAFVTLDAQGRLKHGDETILETDMVFFQEDDQRRLVRTSWAQIRKAIQPTSSSSSN